MKATTVLIGYIRVSTKGQQDGYSLEEQAKMLQEWCDSKGYILVAIYKEIKTAKDDQRPVFQAAVQHAMDANGLIVFNFDRLSRGEALEGVYWMNQFRQRGKLLASVQEEYIRTDATEDDPFGDMPYEMRMSFAKAERRLIKKRLSGGKRAAAAKGSWIGGQIPLGFQVELDRETRIKRLVPCEREQASIAKILELAAQHLSSREIARILTTDNLEAQALGLPLPYPTARGHAHHTNVAVWRIMTGGTRRAG